MLLFLQLFFVDEAWVHKVVHNCRGAHKYFSVNPSRQSQEGVGPVALTGAHAARRTYRPAQP